MMRLLTVDQFAEATGWKPSTIRQKIWRRELPVVRLGRSVRLKESTLSEMVERGTVPALETR